MCFQALPVMNPLGRNAQFGEERQTYLNNKLTVTSSAGFQMKFAGNKHGPGRKILEEGEGSGKTWDLVLAWPLVCL